MVDDFRGRGGSPWGSPPGGGSGNGSGRRGPTPPNIDELIKNLQDKINKFLLAELQVEANQLFLVLQF